MQKIVSMACMIIASFATLENFVLYNCAKDNILRTFIKTYSW